ncbi:MAG: nickel pincer cofactor biosynthesis protein LarC [Spirochaetaceae bacterium]|jgi:uncharacterized protein (TIGR00299 family) protein|nr:nickel pincer cofactor biosynthesis protein LarC [Spirochaetaceae bacterium]
MKTLHFDCFAGISGDMTLGALVDLGVDSRQLTAELEKIHIHNWHLDFKRASRCGIYGTQAIVKINDSSHTHAHHEHAHSSWKEIRELIENSDIQSGAKKRAVKIFSHIAEAEAAVHGVNPEEVHFHEVGAVDSIIDIIGTALCLEMLMPDRITCSSVELGGGFVQCAHGILPVPAPAVLRLCQNIPVTSGGFDKEMTTPTGAGILAACVDEFQPKGPFIPLKTAYGVGMREFEKPNLLRVCWHGAAANTAAGTFWDDEELVLLETNIDDMTGEELGFLMERLFEAGALDVTFTPCTMKKCRPAACVSVLCTPAGVNVLKKEIFEQSAAIGIKTITLQRSALRRHDETIQTPLGMARKKTVQLSCAERSKIEYEDAAVLARERHISLREARKFFENEN